MSIDRDYMSTLEANVDYWRKKHDQAQERARYWAKMYDELLDIKNAELDDDEEQDPDND